MCLALPFSTPSSIPSPVSCDFPQFFLFLCFLFPLSYPSLNFPFMPLYSPLLPQLSSSHNNFISSSLLPPDRTRLCPLVSVPPPPPPHSLLPAFPWYSSLTPYFPSTLPSRDSPPPTIPTSYHPLPPSPIPYIPHSLPPLPSSLVTLSTILSGRKPNATYEVWSRGGGGAEREFQNRYISVFLFLRHKSLR